MRRAAVLLLAVVVLAGAAPAAAQEDPFGPLPQPAPTQEPTPAPVDDGGADIGRTGLILIALGVLVAFAAVIWAITRDARRSLSEHDRDRLDREERGLPGERKVAARAKKKARQRTKAQRAARRRNR